MDVNTSVSSNSLAIYSSRRCVLAGAGAMALATAALRMRSVLAQDGTPMATPVADGSEPQSWLFVQTFTSGSWQPTADLAAFSLHLSGGLVSTIGFTDRPNRDFGVISTEIWMPMLFTPDNPPNAAIVVEVERVKYTFILVLTDPLYEMAADTIKKWTNNNLLAGIGHGGLYKMKGSINSVVYVFYDNTTVEP